MAQAKPTQTYQELKQKLEGILGQLQHEDTDVDEALKLHKEGKEVLAQLEKYLADASRQAGIKSKAD
jgi:exodeoxyribonuclease VII small subunit